MARSGLRFRRVVGLAVAVLALSNAPGGALTLDKEGDLKLGIRTYDNARVGTEATHDGPPMTNDPPTPQNPNGIASPDHVHLAQGTFPHSEAGHLRQNRFYIEAEANYDATRLIKQNVSVFSLLNDLPFKVKRLEAHVTFRGEYESLYDLGPREYSSASDFYKVQRANPPISFVHDENGNAGGQELVDVVKARDTLRKHGTNRQRLFQLYVNGDFGRLFLRVGRQILSWGETDGFQLLDHINPLDSSFGGFLIPLDERRVPLDMALANFYIGDFGEISEMYLEGFAALSNEVGYVPGTPAGSPWAPPGLGAPSNATQVFAISPDANLRHFRGGAQLKFNVFDATFSLAHYYTYFDVPALQLVIHDYSKDPKSRDAGLLTAFNDGGLCGPQSPFAGQHMCGTPVHTYETAPQVQVSGATTTFAVPSLYSVVRSEIAYFKDEPAFSQGQLDPFLFQGVNGHPLARPRPTDPAYNTTGGRRLRDSFNAVVGVDANQWVRFLNPNQTFLISTQFFYKHILDAAGKGPIMVKNANGDWVTNPDREVLPVQVGSWSPKLFGTPQPGLGPIFVGQPADQFLQTFFIGTSYHSGEISPGMTVFYDWGGAFLYQPSLTFSRDPFRFIVDFSVIDAHSYKGGSGVSLLKDRDNVEFRLEYVI